MSEEASHMASSEGDSAEVERNRYGYSADEVLELLADAYRALDRAAEFMASADHELTSEVEFLRDQVRRSHDEMKAASDA